MISLELNDSLVLSIKSSDCFMIGIELLMVSIELSDCLFIRIVLSDCLLNDKC